MQTPEDNAILLVACPDRRGLVATIGNFLYERNANIKHADQHEDTDQGLFLMRVEWGLAGCTTDFEGFHQAFKPIGESFAMTWRMERTMLRPRLALFVSKYDHCLADLLHRWRAGELGCDVSLVIGNHAETAPLAAYYGVPFHHIPVTPATKAEAEERQLELLAQYGVSLVALARYMQVLSADFLTRFAKPIINVHHSFLPAFSGARPYHRAFQRGVKLIGATSHYVTEDLDEGPIIEQDVARVSHRDDVHRLVAKGRDLERLVLSRAVQWHARHRVLVYGNKTVVFD
jgi:formyltetrahydrofolate deformylase